MEIVFHGREIAILYPTGYTSEHRDRASLSLSIFQFINLYDIFKKIF